jgi:hypothetical protein
MTALVIITRATKSRMEWNYMRMILESSAITMTNNIEGSYYLGENICVCTKLIHIREVVYW